MFLSYMMAVNVVIVKEVLKLFFSLEPRAATFYYNTEPKSTALFAPEMDQMPEWFTFLYWQNQKR